MENDKNDIIRQLAQQLRQHEEPYREGAWERYVQHEAKANLRPDETPVPVRPLYSAGRRKWHIGVAVAAALLLIGGFSWLYLGTNQPSDPLNSVPKYGKMNNKSDNKVTDRPSTIPKPSESGDIALDGYAVLTQPATDEQGNSVRIGHLNNQHAGHYRSVRTAIIAFNDPLSKQSLNPANAIAAIDSDASDLTPGLSINPVGPIITIPSQPVTTSSPNKSEDALAVNQQKLNTGERATPTREDAAQVQTAVTHPFDDKGYIGVGESSSGKWNLGVMVVPGISNNSKLNIGYGVSVGYQLTNRLSLNSGLAYSEISGSANADQIQAPVQSVANTYASAGRTLTAIDARVTGLNVPLELRYQLSSKISIGTGVSAMAVLSDKVERRYSIAKMQGTALEASSGYTLRPDAMQSIASDMRTREEIPQDQVSAKDLAGFINFSLGFKQPLNKSKSLSIEPFISVPMSNHLFNQNIKMTDGGIRIKLGL